MTGNSFSGNAWYLYFHSLTSYAILAMKYKIDSPVIENNVEHEEIHYITPSSDDEL